MKIDVETAPDASSFVADANRVSHVLYNLLSNAIGFSEPGSTIRIRCSSDARSAVFVVSDDGCGIEEAHRDRVFERFESHTGRGKHRGAGLGLAIVKSLVSLHGGRVELQSKVGAGTSVTVTFPLAGPPRHENDAHQMAAQSAA